jgi:hypothetical protein
MRFYGSLYRPASLILRLAVALKQAQQNKAIEAIPLR